MRHLTVLYDAQCSLCCRVKRWLERQPKWIAMDFVGAGSPHARKRFPWIDTQDALDEVTVVGDDGAIYRHEKAWLVCLWALKRYRGWSLRLGSPELLPSARKFIDWISAKRK